MTSAKITITEFNGLVKEHLPFFKLFDMEIVEIDASYALLRVPSNINALRPGGTISGPVMMGLADAAFYVAVMANIGLVELAVTTNLSINFLRKPEPIDLYCKASTLKLGKRLAVCEAILYNEKLGIEKPVAHVTGTYSIPPRD